MQVELNREDIHNMVLGTGGPGAYEHPFSKLGKFDGFPNEKWCWNKEALNQMNEVELWNVYKALQGFKRILARVIRLDDASVIVARYVLIADADDVFELFTPVADFATTTVSNTYYQKKASELNADEIDQIKKKHILDTEGRTVMFPDHSLFAVPVHDIDVNPMILRVDMEEQLKQVEFMKSHK